MTPTQQRKHVLTNLSINEISLCDAGANSSTDPRTGRKTQHSVIALFKRDSDCGSAEARLRQLRKLSTRELFAEVGKLQRRKDDPGSQDVDPEDDGELRLPLPLLTSDQKKVKEKKKMGFKKVIKSANVTRDQVVAAVERKAKKIAKREGGSLDVAAAKAWKTFPEAQQAYENAPTGEPKRPQPRMLRQTKAEAELDRRAKLRMKRSGDSYAKCVEKELSADPDLYRLYEAEISSGATFDVPETSPLVATQGGDYNRM
ncbi:MAG: hypothetical protein ABSH45_21465, partial [Bryobacteraceae bacterium]